MKLSLAHLYSQPIINPVLLILSLIICLFTLTSIQIYPTFFFNPPSNLEKLKKEIEKHEKLTWYLVKEIDPYQRDMEHTVYTRELSKLSLFADGRFIMKNKHAKQSGYYSIDQAEKTLILSCYQINHRILTEKTRVIYTYDVKSYNKNRLVLEWQGRHGKIQCHYIQLNRSAITYNVLFF